VRRSDDRHQPIYIRDQALTACAWRAGGRRRPHGDRVIPVFNPATGERLGSVPKATLEEVRHTFDKAHAFQPSSRGPNAPASCKSAAAIIAERLDEVAQPHHGRSRPVPEGLHVRSRPRQRRAALRRDRGARDDGQIFSCDLTPHGKKRRVYTQRAPLLGVISAITPFNHPMNQVAHKVVPSMATNNRMVLKPSEKVPFSAILFADILYEAGCRPRCSAW
jgi:acyl-CoA reductase-like NAD-dependent aldehyde dehydrogenase